MPPETIDPTIPNDPIAAYHLGLSRGASHKRCIITMEDELQLPVDFQGYSDENERETIGSLIESPVYKEVFRFNLLKQAMLKRRQAGMHTNSMAMMRDLHNLANYLTDLVVFYDSASKPIQVIADDDYDREGFIGFQD